MYVKIKILVSEPFCDTFYNVFTYVCMAEICPVLSTENVNKTYVWLNVSTKV